MNRPDPDENLKDPDEFAILILQRIKNEIVSGINYRIKTLEEESPRFKDEKLDELLRMREWVKGRVWKKGEWKDFYPKEDSND